MRTRLLIFILALLAFSLLADPFPPTRNPGWLGNMGVEGGIPNSSNMFVYRVVQPAEGSAGIISALATCPSNQVVQLAPGTFTISQIVQFPQNGSVLRGSGPGVTILHINAGVGLGLYRNTRINCILQGNQSGCYGSGPDNLVGWTGNYSQGTTTITLSSTAGLYVGALIGLDQLNDNNDVDVTGLCGGCGRPGPRSQVQFVKCTGISGNDVTINSPIAMPNWRSSQTPQAWWQVAGSRVEKCGIENMTVDGVSAAGWSPAGLQTMIHGEYAFNCWLKNVTSLYGGGSEHMDWWGSDRCEVRHCTLLHNHGTSSLSYGYVIWYCSGFLIEDCISDDVVSLAMPGGGSFNAVAYCYATNSARNDSGTPYPQAMILGHDGHNCMYLAEGNYGNGFHSDDYHGSGGYDMIFRNRFTGEDRLAARNSICISLEHKQRYFSVVGNILGKPGWTTSFCCGGGLVVLGQEDGISAADSRALLYWHANYDVVNGSIVYATSNADHTLPNSLLYNTKPAYFGILNWPPYGPENGAAIASNPSARTNIPAGYRYVYGVDPPVSIVASTNPVSIIFDSSVVFGTILVSNTAYGTITVSNGGGGFLAGTATAAPPFNIISNASYSIPSNTLYRIGVSYAPTNAASHSGSATFTDNGGNNSFPLSGTATNGPITGWNLFVFSATNGLIAAPFQLGSNYIYQTVFDTTPATGGRATYFFTTTNSGVYEVQGEVIAPNGGENSFFVGFDTLPTDPGDIWPIFPFTANNVFATRNACINSDAPGSLYIPAHQWSLSQGAHQFIVCGREANTLLKTVTIRRINPTYGLTPPTNVIATAKP